MRLEASRADHGLRKQLMDECRSKSIGLLDRLRAGIQKVRPETPSPSPRPLCLHPSPCSQPQPTTHPQPQPNTLTPTNTHPLAGPHRPPRHLPPRQVLPESDVLFDAAGSSTVDEDFFKAANAPMLVVGGGAPYP